MIWTPVNNGIVTDETQEPAKEGVAGVSGLYGSHIRSWRVLRPPFPSCGDRVSIWDRTRTGRLKIHAGEPRCLLATPTSFYLAGNEMRHFAEKMGLASWYSLKARTARFIFAAVDGVPAAP